MGLKNITSVSLKANLSSSSRVIILIDLAGQKPIYYISQNFMVSTRIKKSISLVMILYSKTCLLVTYYYKTMYIPYLRYPRVTSHLQELSIFTAGILQ